MASVSFSNNYVRLVIVFTQSLHTVRLAVSEITPVQTDKQTDGHTDRETDRQTDGQTDREKTRQTELSTTITLAANAREG